MPEQRDIERVTDLVFAATECAISFHPRGRDHEVYCDHPYGGPRYYVGYTSAFTAHDVHNLTLAIISNITRWKNKVTKDMGAIPITKRNWQTIHAGWATVDK